MYSQFKKLKNFLGKRIFTLLFLNSLIGFFNFLVEASFVFILQIFLFNLGLLQKDSVFLPDWIPTGHAFGALLLIGFGIARAVSFALKQYASVVVQQVFIYNQRLELLKRVFKQGSQISNKEMMTIFGEVTSQTGELLKQGSQLLITSISALMFFIYGLYLAPKEMLFGFTILAVVSFPIKAISRNITSSGKELLEHLTSANDSLIKGLKNNYLIKLYSLEDQETNRSEAFLSLYKESFRNYGWSAALMMSIPSLTGVIVIAILAYLGTQVFHTPGIKLVAFFYIFMRFAQSVSESIQIISFFKLSIEGLKKLYHWSIKQDPSIPSNYSSLPSKEKQIKISAERIRFNYEEKTIFKDVNLEITNGDILLIKGKSGSGKSTLLNVLAGMYKPTEGEIYYNGIPGAPANIADLIGYVGPDPYLVHGTIKENLLYGLTKSRTEAELSNCLNKSHMLDTVNSLPLKLETVLSDTAELSTGQKQRLSIARALLRNPKILILDEATSNLDSTTEKQIIANIQELSKDLIILVISHHDSFDSIATQKLSM